MDLGNHKTHPEPSSDGADLVKLCPQSSILEEKGMESSDFKEIIGTYHCRAMEAIETYLTYETNGTHRTFHSVTMKALQTNFYRSTLEAGEFY